MFTQMVLCSNPHCAHVHGVHAIQLAQQASRWACPVCGTISDYAQTEAAQPDISPNAKQFWTLVGVAATIAGLFAFAHIVDQTVERLTAGSSFETLQTTISSPLSPSVRIPGFYQKK